MKTLLVASTLFFSVLSSVGQAESILSPQDKAIAKDAKSIRLLSKDWTIPVNKHSQYGKEEARLAFDDFEKQQSEILQSTAPPEKKKPGGRILVFASTSLGESSLEDLFSMASDHTEAVVVFRGVMDVKNFAKSIMSIQEFAGRQSPVTNTALDPTLFKKFNVTSVPTIIYLDEQQETEIARVVGLSNPKWLLDRVKHGEKGNMGIRGPVEDIAERDLIEVMKEKMAAVDWAEKKEKAVNNFWNKQQFIHLPRAKKHNVKHIDPTIMITADIKDAEGNIIVPRGHQINPLDLKAFSQAVVVFDPLDTKQIALVDKRLAELNSRYSKVTLIVTQFDQAKGWKSYKSITDHYDAPVFKLTSDIVSRFNLENIPSIVTAENQEFIVEELAMDEEEKL